MASPRQQTLRGAIDWSFELCTEAERLLWARASVFAGGFDLSAAEAICAGDGIDAEDVVDLLDTLVDKSIMMFAADAGEGRYRLLETVRSYGQERLRESGAEETFHRRHRDWYRSLAEQAERTWFGPNQVETFAAMKAEHANLRSALEFCLSTPGEARAGMYLAAGLWFFWSPGDFLPEGRLWLTRALALDPTPSPERLKALWVTGRIAVLQGDITTAISLLDECRVEAVRLGDESARAHAIYVLGLAAQRSDDLPVATVLLEEAVARFHALGEINGVSMLSRGFLAIACTVQGNVDRAIELCTESLSICAANGDQWSRSHILFALAHAEWTRGDTRSAAEHVRASLRLKQMFDDVIGIAGDVELLGWIAATEGASERAARLLGASQRIWPVIGTLPLFGFRDLTDARRAATERMRKNLGGPAYDTAFGDGAGLELEQVLAYAAAEPAAEPRKDGHHKDGHRKDGPQKDNVPAPMTQLTKREREIAKLVATGMSNKEIAAALFISQRTAESHVEHILAKLGFTSRAQIAAMLGEQRVS
jgi:non-specific serine/threonine protein kinase